MEYTLSARETSKKVRGWGDFTLIKQYTVRDASGNTDGVFGYVVQHVQRKTVVLVDRGRMPAQRLTTTEEINTFTLGNVGYATHSYYEIFPIYNGVGTEGDQFQSGALLTYYPPDDKHPEAEPNDEPPTTGMINIIGVNVFIPTDEPTARFLRDAIEKNSPPEITVDGVTWTLNQATPAAGLPYTTDFAMPPGPRLVHAVTVKWNVKGKTTIQSEIQRAHRGGRTRRALRRRRKTRRV